MANVVESFFLHYHVVNDAESLYGVANDVVESFVSHYHVAESFVSYDVVNDVAKEWFLFFFWLAQWELSGPDRRGSVWLPKFVTCSSSEPENVSVAPSAPSSSQAEPPSRPSQFFEFHPGV